MNLEQSLKRINELMAIFVTEIEGCTAMALTDPNKVAENILIHIIAEVYGYRNLENLNFTKGSNYPSLDLGDETARVAFQITATPGLKKVKDTLRTFIEHPDKLYEKYDKLIIYILRKKQDSYSDTVINKIINGKFNFDPKKDIWDSQDILKKVYNLPIDRIRKVEKILEENFGQERKQPDREVVDKVKQIVSEHTQLFIGRSKEIEKLDNFLADNSSGVLLVTASAGFGKTSLLASWLKVRHEQGYFIAHHFFSERYDKTRYAKSAYGNLLQQIYRYYERYYEQLPNEIDELKKALYNILREPGKEEKPLVILIDALDELDKTDIPFSPPFPTPLPPNVFVIASARASEGEKPEYLSGWTNDVEPIHLDRLPRCAIADWLKQTGDGELAVFAEDINFVTQLDEITQGFPLYLSYLIDELSHAAKQKQDIRQLLAQTPKGFENYVKQQLKPLDELDLPDERWQFFALLAVAKGALEKQDVKAITGMRDRSLRQLHLCWQVTRWIKISNDESYAFAHPLLGTTFAIELRDDGEDALDKLINYCSHGQGKESRYALRYYAEHLSEAKRCEELYAIARNEDFYSHSIKQFPDEPDLPLKTVQTALLAAAEEDKAGEMAEFMLLHARQLLQTTAQDSPLDALRKGSLERAWRLIDLYEIERRILWYLLLAWELKDTDRFEEAEETLKRLQQQELPCLSTNQAIEWHSEYATYLLAHVFEVSENICISLEQKLFDNSYRCILCAHLRNSGNFTAALKTVESIRPESRQVLELINIAKAQAQKGDIEYSATFTNALEIVNTLVSTSDWIRLIEEIAKAQIEVGDRASAQATLTEALETADNKIDNPLHQVNAFVYLATVQAEVGMVEEALATLQKIKDRPEIDVFLISRGIPNVWWDIGNKDKIKAIFTKYLEIANDIANEKKKTDLLQKVVIAQAEVREFANARETAKKIEGSDRSYALVRIAQEAAKVREFTTALETVEEIEIKHCQLDALSAIAISQAEARNFPGAFETASRIDSLTYRAQAFCGIAIAQAEASPFTDDALEIAEQIESNLEKTQALVEIVRIQGKVKNFPALLKIKDKVSGKEWKDEVLSAIAEAYAKAEDFTTALEIATEIDIQLMRAKTLGVIAEIQVQTGQTETARATFANVLKIEKPLEASISFIRLLALARVAEVQVKNAQKELGVTTASIACEIARSMDNPMETANVLAGILVPILIEAEKIQEAKIICDRAYEIAQQISDNQEYQGSKTFGFVAEAQARLGDFDVALRTLETIRMPYSHVNALRSIAQLQIEAEPQQIEKYKIALNDADEYYKNADSLSLKFANKVQILTIIAVARSTVGETEAALATFAALLEAAQTKEQLQRHKDFSIIAIGYAQIGEFPTAIKISKDIEDGEQKISIFLAIAWEQFKKGEQVTTLDIALAAHEKIEDEEKRLQALKSIAQIQAIAGKGEEALRTLEAMLSDRNTHLRDIALLFAETGDKVNFKRLLIPCAYYLDTAYQMCGYLARLYPEQASAVAKVLSELNEGEQ